MTPQTETGAYENLVVALNAQINPDKAGGVESSVLSIVDSFLMPRNGIALQVIAAERYAQQMAAVTGSAGNVIAWPFPERGPITSHVDGRLGTLRRLSGPGAPLFDAFLKTYRWAKTTRRNSSLQDHDAVLRQRQVSVVHFGYPLKFATDLPYIYEPHDIQHRHYPQFFTKEERRWREKVYSDGCRKAAFVVCGTYWTKCDIIRQFGVAAERVAVVPRSSVKARLQIDKARCVEIVGKLNLPERFAFYPAMTFAHKNHIRLLQAVAELRDRYGVLLPVVCTGRIHKPHFPAIVQELKRLKLEGLVKFLGPIPEESLTAVLQSAMFMVFPSLFEGLSQSLLEGLANRLPIVAANQSSIPETVGQAALLFDGLNTESITNTLLRAVRDPQCLDDVVSHAGSELARYSWDTAALTLAACYKQAAKRSITPEERERFEIAVRSEAIRQPGAAVNV